MQKVLTAEQMREVDRLTTERYGIPSIILMENAAHAVARVITEKLGGSAESKSILILCGKGNNGGDGAALARILFTQWVDVDVYLFGTVEETKGDTRTNFEILSKLAGRQPPFWPSLMLTENAALDDAMKEQIQRADVVVDALFGTGLSRPLDSTFGSTFAYLAAIKEQRAKPLLIAVDVPSGLSADSSDQFRPAFAADATVTFTSPKPANVLPPNSEFCGELTIAEIGTPYEMTLETDSNLILAESIEAKEWLRNSGFSNDSYKNKRGDALVIAGSEDYSGAAVLAANAAMRSGIGLVTLACPADAKAEIASRLLPEVILSTIESAEFDEHVSKADAIAVGCGLDANDADIEKLVREIVEHRKTPVIVDAGALWFYSPFETSLQKPARSTGTDQLDSSEKNPLILTPHEGEFLRLLGTDDNDAIKDRVAAVRDFATKHNVILVLKGERVLIGEPSGKVVVNPTGNSGLGKAGNGDTLTGILAGFVAQAAKMELDIFETVVAAVYVAGMAGDIAEMNFGKRVMTASDVRECLVETFTLLNDE